jgi:hypothetical protein
MPRRDAPVIFLEALLILFLPVLSKEDEFLYLIGDHPGGPCPRLARGDE